MLMTECPPWERTKSVTRDGGAFSSEFPPRMARRKGRKREEERGVSRCSLKEEDRQVWGGRLDHRINGARPEAAHSSSPRPNSLSPMTRP